MERTRELAKKLTHDLIKAGHIRDSAFTAVAQAIEAKVAPLFDAIEAVRPYIETRADSFGSDWKAIEILNKIDRALAVQS